mgnify:CR=1 FL=1
MKKALVVLSGVAFVFLSACNTIEGAGKDVEKGGEKIQRSAEKTKEQM